VYLVEALLALGAEAVAGGVAFMVVLYAPADRQVLRVPVPRVVCALVVVKVAAAARAHARARAERGGHA
jgi:hypothetical protein